MGLDGKDNHRMGGMQAHLGRSWNFFDVGCASVVNSFGSTGLARLDRWFASRDKR